ncbi:MAG: bifunctional 3,4-dihydroxy-2-butanone-4-phosphate synthase/GTP cyclohydrolase II [Acidimicrobiia bacterium]|nr:bifunctional 3,4-dihydroxy-2-butanone-4-phosphate synthase/GTP cyclohydrolase II [Acidimicrobiia bacterium]NNF10813.1 bifunctional 3,4-dihydroxy-2-butanone-4-phosphate synthase/GTP cyclohydrolase II [Acidimicrobiia bacterium]NNL70420.1 bifunctional 3,4-dihydroxy-2-butanone-4-phosphate synthase/GTP cyclohydrolase II [Acidimicrobiia bacterium]
MNYAPIEEAIDAIARGEFLVVVDDEDRENEGDLIIAADKVTPEAIAFMVRYTSGLICMPVTGERLDALQLPLMVADNTDIHRTSFTVSVDYTPGTTTGISAEDRATTIKAMIDPATRPSDMARPGHVFPLRYCEGGVLRRPGHTEAAVDFARLAGLDPAGVLCEIVNDDGTMARGADLERFAKEHGILLVTIADLIAYRRQIEQLVTRTSEVTLPTQEGEFRAIGYRDHVDGAEHLALVHGAIHDGGSVLVRIHSECLTGDVFRSRRCDCGDQLEMAMERIVEAGAGVVIYLGGHEGRGIGLLGKLEAYALQDQGRDTVEANLDLGLPADARDYSAAAQILRDLGLSSVKLLTNNPSKVAAIEAAGLKVVDRIPLSVPATDANHGYLQAKAQKLGHLL